jgi:tetraacyldisaccharide 4'-kinase
LVDVSTGRIYPPGAFTGEPVVAFCGIGNPRAFFADVKEWGFTVAARHSFHDHHVYRVDDLLPIIRNLARTSARALVTTEKDALNLPSFKGGEAPILACATEVALDEAEQFEQALLERLATSRKS